MKITNTVGEEIILGNLHDLTELFTIILDNAVKYSHIDGLITIASKPTDHMVEIQINDKGLGIEKHNLPHLFDRFYRADLSRTKQEINGFGLGLSIAKKIVEKHHGSINIISILHQGTSVKILLPLARKEGN